MHARDDAGVGPVAEPLERRILLAAAGLPFEEDFSDTNLCDAAGTTANWSTAEQALVLNWKQTRYGALTVGTSGADITSEVGLTWSVALGHMGGRLYDYRRHLTEFPAGAARKRGRIKDWLGAGRRGRCFGSLPDTTTFPCARGLAQWEGEGYDRVRLARMCRFTSTGVA